MKQPSNLFLHFKEALHKQKDVVIGYDKGIDATLFYQDHMCNITVFHQDLYSRILDNKDKTVDQIFKGLAKKCPMETVDNGLSYLFLGLLLYYDHRNQTFYIFDLAAGIKRAPSDSLSEPHNLTGSRDGFTENSKDILSLIRGRVKVANLSVDEFCIGKRSKTWVGLLSIDDLHNQENRDEIKEKLEGIDIDSVTSFSDIANQLSPRNILPFYEYIGSPDLASRRLLDGQFILIIDKIPLVLVMPTSFGLLSKLNNDELGGRSFQFLQRSLMLIALVFSTVGLGLFLSALTFQVDSLSLTLLSTLKVTQKGAIFPIWLEVLMILALFEIYHLIGFRSPQSTVSNVIVLIGGLIIGQNAIDSGVVGVIVMTITALSFLCTFIVTNNILLVRGISFIRLLYILSALFMGLFGVTLATIFLLVYFSKQSFLGLHFFHPFIPVDSQGIKYFFTPRSNPSIIKRVKALRLSDSDIKGEQK